MCTLLIIIIIINDYWFCNFYKGYNYKYYERGMALDLYSIILRGLKKDTNEIIVEVN